MKYARTRETLERKAARRPRPPSPLPPVLRDCSSMRADRPLPHYLTFLMVTLFLPTGGPPMMARMTAAFADNLKASNVLHMIEKVRGEVGHFYLTTTLINIRLGTGNGTCHVGLAHAVAILVGDIGGRSQLHSLRRAREPRWRCSRWRPRSPSSYLGTRSWGCAGTYLVIAMIEGQLVQPLLVGPAPMEVRIPC